MFKLPNDDQHALIIGRNGSGKTRAGIWQLGYRSWSRGMPWIIFDAKGDDLIAQLPAIEIPITGPAPTKPGLYVVRPLTHQYSEIEAMLWRIYENQNTGIFADEGYSFNARQGVVNNAYRAILTRGRSRRTPTITLSQRPAWLDVFVFSESTWIQVFDLNIRDDRLKIANNTPISADYKVRPYHSIFYDVKASNEDGSPIVIPLSPVPNDVEIIDIYDRLKPKQVRRRI